MKILLVNKYLMPKGGAETYVFEVGKQLSQMGHAVEYFGMDHPDRIVGNRADSYVPYIDFHQSGLAKLRYPFHIIYSVQARRRLQKVLWDFAPDVVHCNNINYQITPSILYAVRAYERKSGRRVKLFLTAHDVQILCPNHMMINLATHQICEKCVTGGYRHCIAGKCMHGSTLRSVLGAVEGWLYDRLGAYRLLDCIVYPSQFLADKLSPSHKLRGVAYAVLHNFIPIRPRQAVEKGNYILYFGRYSYEKGVATLVEACRRLPDIPFVFAGSGPLEGELAKADNIKNVGFQTGDALDALIARAKCSVLPSECYENSPFSALESIMLHTPVIGARIGGIPELVADGETGLLFESRNADDLCVKIEALWTDDALRARLTENCANAHFESAATYCEKLAHLYQTI